MPGSQQNQRPLTAQGSANIQRWKIHPIDLMESCDVGTVGRQDSETRQVWRMRLMDPVTDVLSAVEYSTAHSSMWAMQADQVSYGYLVTAD